MLSIQTSLLYADSEGITNFSKISGPHQIILEIKPKQPLVGICHFTINIFDIENQEYITDAKVEVFASNEGTEKPYKSFALSNPTMPREYNAKFNFKKSGEWEIKIRSSLENTHHQDVTFNINVKENPLQSQTGGTILWIFVSSILVIAPIILWYKNKH
ncbi:uncharacterized protein METZ01_LOCUS378005 [marine metagenome]|uniref:YtkA-like domain-containing protein n=1 Tax=marine metagenome TaxID=408172 RepID=A0A382TUG1_9ZZZZ